MTYLPSVRPFLERLDDRIVLDTALSSGAQLPQDASTWNPSRILVEFRSDLATATADQAPVGTHIGPVIPLVPGLRAVTLDPGVSVSAALQEFRSDPHVIAAQPDYQ